MSRYVALLVDRPLRRAMLNKCGSAVQIDIEVRAGLALRTARSTSNA
jgi:hypothetical protein